MKQSDSDYSLAYKRQIFESLFPQWKGQNGLQQVRIHTDNTGKQSEA